MPAPRGRVVPTCHSGPVRVLLPPSEAKTDGGRRGPARPVDPALAAARDRVASALAATLTRPDAAQVLGLPARTAEEELSHDATIATAPRRPAIDRYAGVVYSGIDVRTLSPAARRRAASAVLVFSGLYGVVRGDEPVPRYRLSAGVTLPGLGLLSAFWRPVLAEVVPPLLHGLVVDLRSTDYAAMWKAPAGTLAVRVLTPRPGREPAVVSYDSKLGKGRLTRALLDAPAPARTAADVVAAWEAAGGRDATVVGSRLDLLL